jgi:hypothetical protein
MSLRPIGWSGADLKQISTGLLDPTVLPSSIVRVDGSTPFVAPQVGVDPVSPLDLVTQQWVQANAGSPSWQAPVVSATVAVQPGHSAGARYILPAGVSGAAWSGQPTGTIAIDSGSAWSFVTPLPNWTCTANDHSVVYQYISGDWVDISTLITHNTTYGLQGGTTGQYYHLTAAQVAALAGSQTQHYAYLAPLTTSGAPTFRPFDGSDILTGVVSTANGGLGLNASSSSGYPLATAGTITFQTAIPWTSISGKPSTFTPSAHASTHGVAGSDPVALDASQVTTGLLGLARGGLGTSGASITARFAFLGPTSSTGPATFRLITPDDISGASTANQVLSRNSGNTANIWADLTSTFVVVARSVITSPSSTSYLAGGGNLTSDLNLSWQGLDVQVAGSLVHRRPILNFIGATAADNPGNNSVDVTIAGGSTGVDPIVASLIFGS